MKTKHLLVAFAFFCLSSVVNGQNAVLSGCVLNDEDKPEAGLIVIVDGIEFITKADGKFTAHLKGQTPGSPVTISINKQGWAVLKPFMGETEAQNSQTNSTCVSIMIVPKKSPLFLEPDSLSALTGKMQVAAMTVEPKANTKSEIEAARNLEKDKVLANYAKLSGFEVTDILSASRERRKVTSAIGDSKAAAEAYLGKDYNRSGFLHRNAGTNDAEWEKSERETLEKKRNNINQLLRSGNAYFEGFNYKEALVSFEILEKRYFETGKFSKETFKSEWLDMEYSIGRTKVQLASEAKLDEATTLLKEAIDSYKQALSSVAENLFLDNQAKLQYGLGTALLALGKSRFNLRDDISSINLAIVAFNKAAMSVEQLNKMGNSSFDLPSLQISIGEAWYALGEKTSGRESEGYFNKALGAFDKADKAINPDKDKLAWANLNIVRGRTFLNLANITSDPTKRVAHLKKAIDGFQEASTTYTALLDSDQNPCISCTARSLMDLGNAWNILGQTINDPAKNAEYRDKTLEAFDKANKAINRIKREEEPFTLAGLKANLGHAFTNLAVRTGDPVKSAEYLDRAATAHEEAYVLVNQGYCPACAVQSLIELGIVRSMLGQTVRYAAKSVEYFGKALDAFDKADNAINRSKQDGRPLTWAGLKVNLGHAFSNLAARTSDPVKSAEYLDKAATAYDEASALANQDYCSFCSIRLLMALGNAWNILGQITRNSMKNAEYRNKVLEVFDKADKAINSLKSKEEPIIWAESKSRLGIAFMDLASRTSDPVKNAEYLDRAAAAYEAATTVYNSPDVPQDYCSPCAVHSLIDLGNAWDILGQTVRNPAKSVAYSGKALDAYDKADKVINNIKRNEDKFIWAGLKTGLGQIFSNLANRTHDLKKKADYLNKAAMAYEEVATAYNSPDTAQDYCLPCGASTLIALGRAWDTLGRTIRDRSAEYRNKTLEAFDKADKAISRIKREEEPFTWAGLKHDLGDAYSELANGAADPAKNAEYLDKAATAHEEEAKVYAMLLANQDYCPPCVTSALINLGGDWNELGERAAAPTKSIEYFNKALDAFDKADKTIKRGEDKAAWAGLNINLGRTLLNLAKRTSDPTKKADYLNKATIAYEEVATANTTLFPSHSYSSPSAAQSLIELGDAWNILGQTTNDSTKSAEYRNKALEAFDKADKAINRIKREEEPAAWADLKGNLGDAYSELANGAADPAKNAEYLDKAATAYEEVAKVYAMLLANQDYYSPYVTSTLITLGISWNLLGERAAAPTKSIEYFNKALDAFDKADKTIKRGEDKAAWAGLNINLGRTFSNLAYKTSDPTKKTDYLNKAVTSYEEARKIYTLQHNPQEWADVRVFLARAYLSLENWAAALESSNSVLQNFPDNNEAYSTKLGVLHDGLFQFEKAFDLNKEWLERHPDELEAKFEFAEKYFTTGRFAESSQLINILLNNPDIYVEVKTALRAIAIGCLLATDQPKEVSAKLDALIEEVSIQPSNFRVYWIFRGTRHFVGEYKNLAAHREWLKKLFDAIENNDRDTMRENLKDLRAKFKN